MQRLLFIINPIAGKGGNDIMELSNELLVGVHKDYRFTERAGHAYEIAVEAVGKNYDAIVSVGGDGTLHEIAKALIDTDERLGVIPLGSGNGFARHLKIPLSTKESLKHLLKAKLFKADVGKFNQSYFLTTCGFGFDAQVAETFSKYSKRGLWTYVRSIMRDYRKYKSLEYTVRLDGKSFSRKAFILNFANASQYGNGAKIAPNAQLDSGVLLCCVINPFKHRSVLRLVTDLMTGKLLKNPYYHQTAVKHAVIDNYTGSYHLDGEPMHMENTHVEISIKPQSLNLLV